MTNRFNPDPRAKTGTDMATASLAVDVTPHDGEQETLWLGVVAFGRQAETLLRHQQGDLLAVSRGWQRFLSGLSPQDAYTLGCRLCELRQREREVCTHSASLY